MCMYFYVYINVNFFRVKSTEAFVIYFFSLFVDACESGDGDETIFLNPDATNVVCSPAGFNADGDAQWTSGMHKHYL